MTVRRFMTVIANVRQVWLQHVLATVGSGKKTGRKLTFVCFQKYHYHKF